MARGRPRSDSERTQARLLDAAEQLFAAHGIHAVSLRTVNAAAGARNVSAAHYHFGSKERLIRALVERRMDAIARGRLAALDAVEAAAGSSVPGLHALVEAMVLPFVRVVGGDRDAVTFLARVSVEASVPLDELAPAAFWAMVQRFAGLLRRAVPHLTDRALLVRVRFLFQQTFVAVADFERRSRSGAPVVERQALEATVGELIDYLVGGLGAPSHLDPKKVLEEVAMKSLPIMLALVVVAAATASARAHAACLSGNDTLSDQRALASLRDEIEATCPCASYTGGRGLSRTNYRHCAKPFLDGAVAGGTLRSDCRKTALADVRSAMCGTSQVACGRIVASHASNPIACHVKHANRCAGHGRVDENPCAAETHCTDVVTWTAGTCLDGRDPGPAGPGAMHVTYSKPSVVNPSETRVLPTTIWYPTTVTGPIDAATAGVLDAPVDAAGGPLPVVVFSHGNCGFPEQSTFLTALLATRRYLVIAPSHPGSTIVDCAGGTADQVRSALERPSEATWVLDQLLAAGQTPGSPFFGLVDGTRIAMSGHSFGGHTTYKVAQTDPRVHVAVLLAPAVPAINPPALTMPTLTMFGTDDTLVPLQPIRDRFAAASSPKYEVEIAHTGHFAFSNGCFPGYTDCAYPAELSQDEAHAVVLRWVVPFLEARLRGTPGLDALLAPPSPPGVTLSAVP